MNRNDLWNKIEYKIYPDSQPSLLFLPMSVVDEVLH